MLPVSDRQVQDALDQARVTEHNTYRIVDLGDCSYVIKRISICQVVK